MSFVVDGHTPAEVAAHLAADGIAVWDGDNYAYELMSRFGLAETGGAIRASIVLYTTAEEVDRLSTPLRRQRSGVSRLLGSAPGEPGEEALHR